MYMETTLNTKFIGIRRFVSELKLELPFERAQIIQELDSEDWVPHGEVAPVGHNPWPNTRYKCLRPQWKHQALTAVSRYFGSVEFKRQAIDWMYQEYHGIDVTWGMGAEEMCRRSRTHIEFTKDMPGFVNDIHTDYRQLIATGMVYFSDHDTPDLSSYFYTDQNRSNPTRMTTAFGDGWWHMNNYDTWHEGWNRTDQVRYSGLLGLTIYTADLPKDDPQFPH
jgi:hypothetical protein